MCILKCLGNNERKFNSEMLFVIETDLVSSQLIGIVFKVRFRINLVSLSKQSLI